MKKQVIVILAVAVLAIVAFTISGNADEEKKKDILAGTIEGLIVDNMMTSQLEIAEGIEVVVSHVVIPPNTVLSKHWHPGEEFAYVIEGSISLWQKDKGETLMEKGDVAKISLKQIHSAKSMDEGATVLVFRVHEEGQPVRVNVE
jgi:quercetin dioxygenase-like cupin family protein